MNEQTKVCADCGRERLAKFFYRDPTRRDGLSVYCKTCLTARVAIPDLAMRELRDRHKEEYAEILALFKERYNRRKGGKKSEENV